MKRMIIGLFIILGSVVFAQNTNLTVTMDDINYQVSLFKQIIAGIKAGGWKWVTGNLVLFGVCFVLLATILSKIVLKFGIILVDKIPGEKDNIFYKTKIVPIARGILRGAQILSQWFSIKK